MSHKIHSRSMIVRNMAMYVLSKAGVTHREIGIQYGITASRVSKIIRAERLKYEASLPRTYDTLYQMVKERKERKESATVAGRA